MTPGRHRLSCRLQTRANLLIEEALDLLGGGFLEGFLLFADLADAGEGGKVLIGLGLDLLQQALDGGF